MEDINKNDFNTENIGDEENKKERNESNVENQYSEGKKICQESQKDGKENSQDQRKILPQEQKEALQEGEETSPSYSKTASVNSTEEKGESAKYSTSYSPPYYVPNFTVSSSSEGGFTQPPADESKPPKKSKKWLIPLIAVAVLIALLLTGVLGMGLGYIAHNVFGFPESSEDTDTDESTEIIGDETVTIIKNDGSIEIDGQLGSTGYSGLSVSEITALVADSVVEINTSQTVNSFYYGQYITSGAGSGVIIGHVKNSNVYYVVTNYHVIEGADSVKLRLRNGSNYNCTVVAGSALDDLAILRISAKDGESLTVATLGKSANLKVGDGVVAIGNPLGTLGGTVTDGIISALDREIMVENNIMVLLQTNAAINPGNSGGGLFNSAGELVGIVNAKQSDTGIEGLGFAIPIDRASKCISDLLQYGYVKGHSSLGVKIQAVQLSGFNTSNYLQVTATVSGSSLEVGDVIRSVNGEAVNSIASFNAIVYRLKVGEEVTVQVLQRNSFGQNEWVNKKVKVVEYNPKNFS